MTATYLRGFILHFLRDPGAEAGHALARE